MTATALIKGLNKAIHDAGTKIRVRYFNQTYDDVYDDSVELTKSGTDLWTSGIVFSLNSRPASTDSLLMEQGKLNNSDKKMFVNGSMIVTGSELQCKIMIGSPGEDFAVIPDGCLIQEAEGVAIYKRIFLRRLTGSLIGEM